MRKPCRILLAAGCALSFFGAYPVQTAPPPSTPAAPPTLEHPAVISPLATHSLLTAVTHAGNRLVAVGERGHIMLSDDNGTSWHQAVVPVSVTLTAVRFITPTTGWAVGHAGVVLRSDDGGQSWRKQLDGLTVAQLVADSGDTYGKRLLTDGADKPFFDLWAPNEREIVIIGAFGLIFASHDGGKSWVPALDRLDNPERKHLYAIREHAGTLYLAGEQGLLARKPPDADRFEALDSPYAGSFFDLLVTGGGNLLAFGLRGNVMRSTDRGSSWSAVIPPTGRSFTGGTVTAHGVVLVDEGGGVWLGDDDGRTLAQAEVTMPFPLSGIADLPGGGLIAVGARGAIVLATTTPRF